MSPTTNGFPLLDLPAELLIIIARHLSTDEILHLGQVNRRYHVTVTSFAYERQIRCEAESAKPLWWAAEHGLVDLAARVLALGANPNEHRCRSFHHHSARVWEQPLHVAIRAGDLPMTKLLLEHGAHPAAMSNMETSLTLAANRGHLEIVRLLLELDRDNSPMPFARLHNLPNHDGSFALHEASENGHVEVVRFLLQHGARVDVRDHRGRTPLSRAVKNQHYNVVQTLLDARADPFVIDNAESFDSLSRATYSVALNNASPASMKILIAILKSVQRSGHGKVWITVPDGALGDALSSVRNVIFTMLEMGVEPDALTSCGKTSLWNRMGWHSNQYGGHGRDELKEAALLIQRGAAVNFVCRNSGMTPLMRAAQVGRNDLLELLLKNGADVAAEDYTGATALAYAAASGSFHNLELIINHVKADITAAKDDAEKAKLWAKLSSMLNGLNRLGDPPLISAMLAESHISVDLLLESGADVTVASQDGQTLLSVAAGYDMPVLIGRVIEKGGDIEHRSKIDETPLMRAVRREAFDGAKALLDHGANANALCKRKNAATMANGATQTLQCPLGTSVRRGNYQITKLLLARGANLETAKSLDPGMIERAKEEKHHHLYRLLLKYDAMENEEKRKKERAQQNTLNKTKKLTARPQTHGTKRSSPNDPTLDEVTEQGGRRVTRSKRSRG